MKDQLLVVPAGHESGQRDDRATATVQTRAGPDLPPGVRRDQLLEVAGEGREVCAGGVDVLAPEPLPPYRHAVLMTHAVLSVRARQCSRISAAICSGASAGAR